MSEPCGSTKPLVHSKDADCNVDPATDTCRVCGVYHGKPCDECGGSGFHTSECCSEEADDQRDYCPADLNDLAEEKSATATRAESLAAKFVTALNAGA